MTKKGTHEKKNDVGLPKTSLAEDFSLSGKSLGDVVLAVQVKRTVVLSVDNLLPVDLWRPSSVSDSWIMGWS